MPVFKNEDNGTWCDGWILSKSENTLQASESPWG